MAQFFLKIDFLVQHMGTSQNGFSLRSPSLIMAPAFYPFSVFLPISNFSLLSYEGASAEERGLEPIIFRFTPFQINRKEQRGGGGGAGGWLKGQQRYFCTTHDFADREDLSKGYSNPERSWR